MRHMLQGMFTSKVDESGKKRYEVAQSFSSEAINAHATLAKTTTQDNLAKLDSMLRDNNTSGLKEMAKGDGMLRSTTTGLKSMRQMCDFAKLDGKPVTNVERYFSSSAANLLDTNIKQGVPFQSLGTLDSYKSGPLSTGLAQQRPQILEHMQQIALLGKQLAQYEASPATFRVPTEPMAAHTAKAEHVVSSYTNMASITNAQRLEAEKNGVVSHSDAATLAKLTKTDTARSDSITSSAVSNRPSLSTATSGSSHSINTMSTAPTSFTAEEEAQIAAFDEMVAKNGPQLGRNAKIRQPGLESNSTSKTSTIKATPANPANVTNAASANQRLPVQDRIDISDRSAFAKPEQKKPDPAFKRKPLPETALQSPNRQSRLAVFKQAQPLLRQVEHGRIAPQDNPVAYNKLEQLARNDPELTNHLQTLLGNETADDREKRQAHGVG